MLRGSILLQLNARKEKSLITKEKSSESKISCIELETCSTTKSKIIDKDFKIKKMSELQVHLTLRNPTVERT